MSDPNTTSSQTEERYLAVVNDEEQYSVWWAGRDLPPGWQATGTEGTKDECLAWIADNWVDMRPLSLRNKRRAAS